MKTTIEQLPLTPKQQLFCDEYLMDMNATRAALRAGYSEAMALSGKLMQVPKIRVYIKLCTKKAAKKMEVSRDKFLAELQCIAFANMGDYFDNSGKMKPMKQLTRDQKAAIWNIKVTEDNKRSTLQLRLNNKLSALEKIGRHLGFYNAVAEEPEIKYVYLDKDAMDEFDRLEDEAMAEPKSEVGGRKAEEVGESDEPVVKDGRWERDKALFMEQELERLKRELHGQKERARLEAEAEGDRAWLAEGGKPEEVLAGAGVPPVEEKEAAPEMAVQTEPVKTELYISGGLIGKAISEEVLKERRQDRRDREYERMCVLRR